MPVSNITLASRLNTLIYKKHILVISSSLSVYISKCYENKYCTVQGHLQFSEGVNSHSEY